MPINLTNWHRYWPTYLKPIGFGEAERETFVAWWTRNEARLPPLDQGVYEQWVYKHWTGSPYRGLPLDGLRFLREKRTTEFLLTQVGSVDQDALVRDQEWTYKELNSIRHDFEPVSTMNRIGTWNFPVLVIQSSDGFVCFGKLSQSYSLWLIEGHLRMRYLAALAACGKSAEEHDVLVISYGNRRTRARVPSSRQSWAVYNEAI